jgi:transposase
MPRALSVDLRQTIIECHRAGASLAAVATELALSPWTVRTLWRRYRDRGDAGLVPDYAACGRPGPRHPQPLYAHALILRRAHPGWGAGVIRTELAQQHPQLALPHEATLRRWFRDAGLAPSPPPPRPPNPPRAQVPHERWQLDATEHIPLGQRQPGELAGGQRRGDGGDAGGGRFPPPATG